MTRSEKHEYIERNHSKLADAMWIAIDGKIPINEWIPIRTNREVAVDIICMFIDLNCYEQGFGLILNSDQSSFMKLEGAGNFKSSKVIKKEKTDEVGCTVKCSLGDRNK